MRKLIRYEFLSIEKRDPNRRLLFKRTTVRSTSILTELDGELLALTQSKKARDLRIVFGGAEKPRTLFD